MRLLFETEELTEKVLLYLLSIADKRDHDKIEYLFNTYNSDMIRFAKFRFKYAGVKSYSVDAEDAVQNAFVRIIKYISAIDFEADETTIRSYVLSIVSNEVANILTDYKETEDIDAYASSLSDDSFMEQLQINEQYEGVVAAIEKLDEKYGTALLFRYRDEMTVKEISGLLGISEKAVYARLERGKRILLQKVGQKLANV